MRLGIIPILLGAGPRPLGGRSSIGRRAVALASIAVVAGAAASCERSDAGASAGRISVVASFYPLAEAAARVGGDDVAVTDLTPPGVEPHDLELDPNQVADLADADVVLYLGGGFQPAVEDAVAAAASGQRIDVLRGMPTTSAPPETGESTALEVDPHVWLDPVLMRRIVGVVRRALDRADPSREARFERNAAAFDDQLAALDADYRAGLASCRLRTIVTTHAAFGYLASEYGLTQEPITGISPEAEPDPKRLAGLVSMIERNGTTTIFTEPLVSSKVADTLASEAGVATAVLNPLEGLTPDQIASGADYVSVMRDNLAALRRGLGCS